MATAERDYQGVDGNWNNPANWSGATVPVSGVNARLGDSNKNIDTNIDNQDAVALENLFIGETFTGNLGGAGNRLEIDCTALLTVRSGGEETWIKGAFPEVHAAPVKSTANAFVFETDDCDRLFVLRGWTTLVDGSAVVLVQMVRGMNDARLIIQANTTISGDIHIPSGVVEMDGTCSGIIYVSGSGRLIVTENASINRLVMADGVTEWVNGDFTHDVAGVPTILVKGGFFDAHLLVKTHTVPRTWALGSAASLDFRSGQQNVIRTASKQIGTPQIKLDDGDTF